MSDIFNQGHVLLGLDVRTRDEAFRVVADAALRDGVADDARALYCDFHAREDEAPTGLLDGFAIPHAKTDAARCAALYYARAARPLAWETLDGLPVTHMLFLIAPASDGDNTHLRMLAALAASLMEDDFKAALAAAVTPEEVARAIQGGIEGADI